MVCLRNRPATATAVTAHSSTNMATKTESSDEVSLDGAALLAAFECGSFRRGRRGGSCDGGSAAAGDQPPPPSSLPPAARPVPFGTFYRRNFKKAFRYSSRLSEALCRPARRTVCSSFHQARRVRNMPIPPPFVRSLLLIIAFQQRRFLPCS